jgi:hypothetical protein
MLAHVQVRCLLDDALNSLAIRSTQQCEAQYKGGAHLSSWRLGAVLFWPQSTVKGSVA